MLYYPAVTVCDGLRGRVSWWVDLQDSLTALLFNFSNPKVLASYSCNILKTLAKCAAIIISGILLDDSPLSISARLFNLSVASTIREDIQ